MKHKKKKEEKRRRRRGNVAARIKRNCPRGTESINRISAKRGGKGRKTVVPEFWRRRSINYRVVRTGGSSLKEDGQFGWRRGGEDE